MTGRCSRIPAAAVKWLMSRFGMRQDGSVVIIFALLLPVLLAGLALAVETGMWFAAQRKLQHAADTATYSAAVAMVSGASQAEVVGTARRVALASGLRPDTGQVAVTFPAEDRIEVVLRDSRPYILVRAMERLVDGSDRFGGAISLTARAVATITAQDQEELPVCVHVLGTAGMTLDMGGNSSLSIPTCTVEVVSGGSPAASIGGAAWIDAACVTAAGSISGIGAITTTECRAPRPNGSPAPLFPQLQTLPTVANPRSVPAQALGNNERTVTASFTGHPSGVPMRRFQGGLNLNGNTAYVFGPGIYIIDGGSFRTGNRTTLTATQGAAFFLMNGAYLDFHGGTVSRLSGLTSGPWANIVLFDSNDAPSAQNHTLVTSQLDGIVYLPRAVFGLSGGSSVGEGCFIIAVGSLRMTGGSGMVAECEITSVDLSGYWGDSRDLPPDIRLIE